MFFAKSMAEIPTLEDMRRRHVCRNQPPEPSSQVNGGTQGPETCADVSSIK